VSYIYQNESEAFQAIKARINGEFDNAQLIKLGELDVSVSNDIERIVASVQPPS